MRRLAVLATWLVALASPVAARDLDVVWKVPQGVCPDREQLRAGLVRRLGREVVFGSDAPLQLEGIIEAEGGGYVLALRTHAASGEQQRTLRAQGCNELARASVLIAALLFAQAPPRASEPDAVASEAEARQPRLYARAQLTGDLGALPALALGPGLVMGVRLGRIALEVGGMYFLSQQASLSSQSRPVASLQLTTAVLSGCVQLIDSPALAPCLRLEAGRLHATGHNVARVEDGDVLWLMLGAGIRLGLPLTRWLHWQTELAAGLPYDRAQFAVRELGPVHEVPPVVGRFGTGLEGRF